MSKDDHIVTGATNTIRTWAVRQKTKGREHGRIRIMVEIKKRWPALSREQVAEITERIAEQLFLPPLT